MAPDQDWRWLRDITNKLDAWAEANTVKKDTFPITAPEIYSRCLIVLDGLMAEPLTRPTERNKFRDTLIIALLTACPIRLRNLTMIEIGTHLIQSDTEWRLVFKSNETKTGEPLGYIIPDDLVPHLSHYINHIRRHYRGSEGTRRLWMGLKKAPLSYEAIYGAVTARSKALFGVALSPTTFAALPRPSCRRHPPLTPFMHDRCSAIAVLRQPSAITPAPIRFPPAAEPQTSSGRSAMDEPPDGHSGSDVN
jgi:hypothetical protein